MRVRLLVGLCYLVEQLAAIVTGGMADCIIRTNKFPSLAAANITERTSTQGKHYRDVQLLSSLGGLSLGRWTFQLS
jgi:hypothetical protein